MVTTPTLWRVETQANVADGGLQQYQPQIVALQDGGFFVLWTDRSGVHNAGGGAIVGRYYTAVGTARTGEIELSDDGDFSGAAVVLNPSVNRLRVAYVEEQAGEDAIVNKRFNPETGALVATDTRILMSSEDPHIAAGATESAGSFFVYTQSTSSGDIVGARGNGAFSFGVHSEPDRADFARVAALGGDKFVVVWQDEVNGSVADHNVEMAIFASDDNMPFLPPVSVAGAAGSADETRPDVAGLAGGGFVVIWHETSGIRATLYTGSGVLVAADILVDAGTSSDARVIRLADGGFIVSWADLDANLTLGQRFNAAGVKVGGNFTINGSAGVVEGTLLADGRVAFATVDTTGLDSDIKISIWDPRTGPINGTAGNDALTARHEGSVVNGLAGADSMWGLNGNDRLNGGSGVDRMSGGLGNDVFYVDNAADKVFELAGQGSDAVYASVNYTLAAGQHIETLATTALTGTGTLSLAGNELAQRINGNNGNNGLYGNGGNDVLVGYGGNDVLYGGIGNDTLTGGAGNDYFVFHTALSPSTNVDRVTDFAVPNDTIRLDNAVMAGLGTTLGTLAAAKFWKSTSGLAHDADDRIIYETDTGKLFYDANGSASGNGVHFATLAPNLALTHADFQVV